MGKADLSGRNCIRYLDDLTMLTVTYGRTELVDTAVCSLFHQLGFGIPVVVVNNNGVHRPARHRSFFTEVDNTGRKCFLEKGDEFVESLHQPSRSHCSAASYGLDNVVRTRYCLLCDDDVIFKPEIKFLLSLPAAWSAVGAVCPGVKNHHTSRLLPFMCLIDVDRMKKDGIHYFDADYCVFARNKPDTGASFLRDINARGWRIKHLRTIDDFVVHLAHGSLGIGEKRIPDERRFQVYREQTGEEWTQ